MQHCRQNHGAEQREHTAGEVPQRTTLIYFWRWLVANVCLLPKKYRNGEEGSSPHTGGTFNSETAIAATSRDSSERSMKSKASKSEANSCYASIANRQGRVLWIHRRLLAPLGISQSLFPPL